MPLEVVADDGEGRRVGQRRARPEQHAVRQIQGDNLGEREGRARYISSKWTDLT